MNPRELARELRAVADRWDTGLREVMAESVRDAFETARQHSEGTQSTSDLRRAGHPYAKRHGRPRRDPSRINLQGMGFWMGWSMDGPRVDGGILAGTVTNQSDHAGFLKGGTRYMFARPIDERVIAEVAPRFEARTRAQLHIIIRR